MRVPSSVAGVVLFPVVVAAGAVRRLVRGVVRRLARWVATALGLPRTMLGRVARRMRQRLRPQEPSPAEVLGLLREHREELTRSPREVLDAAQEAGVSRRTLRRWLRRHGAKRLELSLEAGLGEDDLRTHLSAGSLPPVWALEMLADEGGPVPPPVARR